LHTEGCCFAEAALLVDSSECLSTSCSVLEPTIWSARHPMYEKFCFSSPKGFALKKPWEAWPDVEWLS